ncbi:MAG: hypothetical protein LBR80_18460 [Deltaproteobacteria bacterium]|jgi:hypothetical protein|nr:hypothetical protein [Deltaproteobacteria bacterium]
MTVFPDMARFLSLFSASPVFAADVPDTEGWTLFGSREPLPGIKPSFSLRLPPPFTFESFVDPAHVQRLAEDSLLEILFPCRGTGRAVTLKISRWPRGRDTRVIAKTVGLKAYWTLIGGEFSSIDGTRLEEVRTFSMDGSHARDLAFSWLPRRITYGFSSCSAIRIIVVGECQYLLTITCMFPAGEPKSRGHTPPKQPLFREIAKPVLDSLAFVP